MDRKKKNKRPMMSDKAAEKAFKELIPITMGGSAVKIIGECMGKLKDDEVFIITVARTRIGVTTGKIEKAEFDEEDPAIRVP